MNIFPNNDMIVTLTGLVGPDGQPIASATITATLTWRGQAVSGVSPITLAAVNGQPGSYSGQLPAADFIVGRQYQLTIADGTSLTVTVTLSAVLRAS